MPIFRSQQQMEICTLLFLRADHELTIADIIAATAFAKTSVLRDVDLLCQAQLATSRTQGRNRLISANTDHPVAGPLTQILTYMYGPQFVVAEEFTTLDGVESTLIFGSWAARHAGHPGPPPADVDVLAIGDISRLDLFDAADRASTRLGIEVNPITCTRDRWEHPEGDPTITQIQASATLPVSEPVVSSANGSKVKADLRWAGH